MLADWGGVSVAWLGCEPSAEGAWGVPTGDDGSASADGSEKVTDEDDGFGDGARGAGRCGCPLLPVEPGVGVEDADGGGSAVAARGGGADVVGCGRDGGGTVGGGAARVPCPSRLKSRSSLGPIVSFEGGAC
jgi:hypothetical protein